VINLRGQVVPVIDLQVRFGGQSTTLNKRTCIVIVEVATEDDEHQIIGVMVDAVSEVLAIPTQDIERAPSFGARLRQDFISGMGKVDGRFVIILAIDQVLSLAELSTLSGRVEAQAEV
jgi:purine-binding chemotaxis protein CheW